jgi:glucokinase
MILAGDIGGTNARLALFDRDDERFTPAVVKVFPSRDHGSLAEIVGEFVDEHKQVVAQACFGVAGPVIDGRVETPNLPWVADSGTLAGVLGLESVLLINDLEANAYGVSLLGQDDFYVLNEGTSGSEGNAAIISAGTGLGEAGLVWDGKHHRPFPTEGGHTDFSPRSELEMELLSYLMDRYERVSWERVVSGPGLFNIYTFLRDSGRGQESVWLSEKMDLEDPPAVISQAALEGSCELCVKALEMFISAYGAEAGNLALKFLASGGVYLGGGIAPKIIPKIERSLFMESFMAKGRLRSLLETVPVRVILNEHTALLGAARRASL